MKITTLLFISVSTIFLLQSCNKDSCATKSGFLESFEAFSKEYDENKADLDEEKKMEYENRYRDIVNNCYKKFKDEMSLEEKQGFWKQSLSFYMNRYDGQFSANLLEKLDDPFNQYLKEEVVEIIKESGLTYVLSLQSIVKDELPKLMELFSDEIEKFGQQLFGSPQD